MEDKIKKFCQKFGVIFGYLFGSCCNQLQKTPRDLDLAVFLKEPESSSLAEMNSELSKLLNIERVDILVLNKAGLFMQFKILQRGKLIYSADELQRIRYETKVISHYFDRQYYYRRHTAKNLDRIAKRGLL